MPQDLNIEFSNLKEVQKYLGEINKLKEPLRHENYAQSVVHANQMGVHICGDSPGDLLNAYRPNEAQDIHSYRLSIYEPITKAKSDKILNTLARIESSKNFSINFPEKGSNLIPDEETLFAYSSQKFPFFGSMTKWLFNIVLKQDIADPNTVIAFRPLSFEVEETEFTEPFPFVFPAQRVVDFKAGRYYTFFLKETNPFKVGAIKKEGKIFHFYTPNEIIEARQTGEKDGKAVYEINTLWTHNFNSIPVVWTRGDFVKDTIPFLYTSYVSGVLPFWNKAIRIDSDLDAQFVMHAYLERAEIQVECDANCSPNDKGVNVICTDPGKNSFKTCGRCGGAGFILGRTPYGTISVKEDKLSEKDVVFPGVEYISKPTDIVKLSEDKLDKLITEGLSAINMEFLADTPLNESGKAKEVDRMELNSFIEKISNNLFRILQESIFWINKYRYGAILGENVNKQLPDINKPVEFNILTSTMLSNELSQLKNSNTSQDIIDNVEMELIEKKFSSNDTLKAISNAIILLDPLRGKSPDEKFAITSQINTTQAKEDFIISSFIKPFILRAFEEDAGFFEKTREEKIEILRTFANEKLTQPTVIPLNVVDEERKGQAQ